MPTCPVCDSVRVEDHGDLLWSCLYCSHVFEYPALVKANYDAEYVQARYDKYDTTPLMSHLRLGLVKAFANGGKLLDVGYGNGDFVKLAVKAGFDAYGNDVHGADYGVREAGLLDKKWDVVTFFDSLEHFPDLDEPRQIGKTASCVIVSMPQRPDEFPKSRDWKHYRPGEHLHYFSPLSLAKLFNMELVRVLDLEGVIRGSDTIFTAVFHR